ncbi:MAG: nickel-responsive transcriptional regulator NikR, partial [Stellaceae bacterium]
NRSEALRDLARIGLGHARVQQSRGGECVATLSYVFDHQTRELAKRLTSMHHAHHEVQVAALHVHLDHASCLEVSVLRGDTAAVRDFARSVIAERGVTHGEVTLVPGVVEASAHAHARHGARARAHLHAHPRP